MKIGDKLFSSVGVLHLRSKPMQKNSEVLHLIVKLKAAENRSTTKNITLSQV